MKQIALFALAITLLLTGCTQQPKQMELCDYHLWATGKWYALFDLFRSDSSTVEEKAQIAREIEAQPAPETVQRYKDLMIEIFTVYAMRERVQEARKTAEASKTATMEEMETELAQLHSVLDTVDVLWNQWDIEKAQLDALCPEEAQKIEQLYDISATVTP